MSDMFWMLKLGDGMSGPASSMAKGLRGVDGAIKNTDSGVKGLSDAMSKAAGDAKALSSALAKIKAPSLDGVSKAGQAASRAAATDRFATAMTVSKGISRAYEAARQTQTSRDDALAANLVKSKIDRLMSVDKRSMELLSTGMKQKAGFGEWWAKSSSKGTGPGPSVFSKLIGGANKLSPALGGKLLGGAEKLAGWDEKLQGWGMSLDGVAKTGLGAIGIGAAAAVAAIAAIGVAIGAIIFKLGELAVAGAAAFTKFAVQTLSFRENTLIAFETILRSKEAAADLYDAATEFAAVTPFQTDQIMGAYQKLLVAGFKKNELATMMNAVGDVAAMKGFDPQVMNEMIAGFAKLRGMGKLSGEVLEMEAFQGMKGSILDQLAAEKGKTKDEIQAMISAGKIDATTAEKVILDVIKNTYSGGELGGAMKKFSTTWTGLWSTLASRGSDLFNAAAKGADSGLTRYFESIKTFVGWLGEALNPKSATGSRVVAIIERIGGAFAGMSTIFTTDGATNTFSKILTVVETLMPYLEAFMKGLGPGFQAALKPIGMLLESLGKDPKKMDSLVKGFEALGWVVGYVAGNVIPLFVLGMGLLTGAIATVAGVIGKVIQLFQLLTGAPTKALEQMRTAFNISLFSDGSNIGRSLIDGMVSGITGGVAAVAGAASGAASAVVAAASGPKGFDAHSPSKKFEKLGGYASEGLAIGITKQAPTANAAVADMVAPPSQSSVAGQWSSAPSGGGSSGPTVVINGLTINAPSGEAQDIKSALLDAFEGIALQLNGAPA